MATWMGSDQMYAQRIHDHLVQSGAARVLRAPARCNLRLGADGLYSVCLVFPNSVGHNIVLMKRGARVECFDPNGRHFAQSGCGDSSENPYKYCVRVNGAPPSLRITPKTMINTSASTRAHRLYSGLCLLWCIVFIIAHKHDRRDIVPLLDRTRDCERLIRRVHAKVEAGIYAFERLVLDELDALLPAYRRASRDVDVLVWRSEKLSNELRRSLHVNACVPTHAD